MDFSQAVQAQLAGLKVRRSLLVKFDFVSGPVRLWNGVRTLKTADGQEWRGMHGLGSVQGLQQAINGAAPELRLTISGVDKDFAGKAKAEASEYINRAVTVYAQFFTEDWALLDAPFAVAWARMRGIVARKEATDQGILRAVTVTAETPFGETKRRPRASYVVDRDQQMRWPNDRANERTPGFESKLVTFPT